MALTYNWDIIGHDKPLGLLEADIHNGQVSHAYLFSGPDSVGKFTAAKRMAHIVQCKERFCGECSTCHEIARGYHSDTIEFVDDGHSVKIEAVRKVMEQLNMSARSPFKVFLLQNIERLTLESGNALLKTLEDPPGNVLFLLTTSRVSEVIPTLISRTRLLPFGRLADEDLIALVRKIYPLMEEDVVTMAAEMALGRPGKALALVSDREMYDRYQKMYEDIEMFLRSPERAKQFLYVEELVKSSKDTGPELLREFVDMLQLVLRRELMMNVAGERAIFSRDKLVGLLDKALEAQHLLQRNVNSRLLLENMMLAL